MLGSPSFEPEPAGWANHGGHEPDPSSGDSVEDIEIDWHLAYFDRTGSRLPDGVFDELTREARELLHLEWQVFEPDRIHAEHGGRPAVSPSTVMRSAQEATGFRRLLDQLWQDRHSLRKDRRRSIIDAVQAEAESLRMELRGTDLGIDQYVIESVVGRYATRLSSRSDDRSDQPDMDRAIRELTDKLRLLVGVAVVTELPGSTARLTELAREDATVRAAWLECAHHDIPAPRPADGPTAEVAPELFGRDPARHLKLMLDPSGPVGSRPVPRTLRQALRTPDEGAEIGAAVAQEFRRAACPGGLSDPALRARWFLATLYAGSCWTAARLAAQVRQHTELDQVSALRRLIGSVPAPHTLDRVRGAALLQATAPPSGPADPDGWQRPMADVAFDGARSSRFAIPIDVALEVAPIDTCGVRLRGYLGNDWANRAARFGEVGIEQLCELTVGRFHHTIHQRLLKDDQLGTGHLRGTTPTNWHAITTKQMRRAACTVLKQFRAGRPLMDDTPEPPSPQSEPDGFRAVVDGLDPDVVELLTVGRRAPAVLATMTDRWLATRHSRVGIAMNRRLAELRLFRVWLDDEISRAESSAQVTAPTLQRTEVPLRQALHHFVLAGGHRTNGPDPTPDTRPPRSDQATTRAAQRASEGLYRAVTTMLVDLSALPDREDLT